MTGQCQDDEGFMTWACRGTLAALAMGQMGVVMQRLGFIGTGTITAHMVRGMQAAGLGWPVVLSPRNEGVARELAELPGVRVAASNQAVLDAAEGVVLAVRPQVAEGVVRGLRFAPDRPVISLIAALPIDTLRGWTGVREICRAIPLPFVERCTGVTPVFPPQPVAMELFDALGTALPVQDAVAFDSYATASALMGTYFGLVDTACGWMAAQGIPEADARTYVAALFADLGATLRDTALTPEALRVAHSTKGGLNEQLHRVFAGQGGEAAVQAGLAAVLARVRDG